MIKSCNLVAHHGLQTHESFISNFLRPTLKSQSQTNEWDVNIKTKIIFWITLNTSYHGVAQCKYQMYHIQVVLVLYKSAVATAHCWMPFLLSFALSLLFPWTPFSMCMRFIYLLSKITVCKPFKKIWYEK